MLCFLPDPRRTTRHTVLLPGIALLVIALAFATGCKVNILFGSSVPTTPPTAVADAFSHPGNSTLTVNAANGLLNNDTGGGLSCTAYSGTGNTTQGGDVAVNADGSFTYTPVAGFTGSDTFSYTVTNSKGSDPTGMCTITVGTLVWYINSSAAGGGTGRDIDPFDSISAFNTADPSNTNQFIYLFTGAGNYTGPIDLKPGQSLIGAGVDLVVDTVTLRTAATRPTIVNPAGNGVTVQANNTVRGVNFGDTPTGAAILNSADATNLVINNVAISGSGRTVRILNTVSSAMTVTIDSLTSTSTTNTALELDGFTGSFTVTGATTLNSSLQGVISIANVGASTTLTFDTISITNRSEFGIVLANFNATATITTGDITLGAVTATPQNALLLDNFDGTATVGTMSLDGDTGTAFLINNGTGGSFTAGDTTLTGANGLDIDTSTGTFTFASLGITSSNGFGIRANSGTVNIVASTTTVSSTNGAAVDLTGTSAGQTNGAAGWTFATLSSTNGAFGFRNNGANSDVTVTGTTTINGSTNTGISIAATTATFIFTGAVTLSTVGDAFVCGTASGDIRFPGGFSGNTITSTTGRGIVATSSNIDITPTNTSVSTKEAALTFNCANVGRLRTNGVSGITFADITQANSSDTGLRITNNIDPVTITGTVSLTTAGNEGMQINNTASAIVFQGTVTVSGAGNSGIRINVAGAAVTFQGAVTVTTSGNGATEAAIAILATAAAGSVTFQGAVSTTNGNTGIGIVASDGSIVFQSDITIGTTVNSGLVISGISATGSFSATGGTIGVSGTDSSNNGTDNNITVNNCAGTVTLESDGGTLVANPIQANVRITGSSGAVTLRGTTSSWTLNNAGTGANDPDHGIAIINSSNVTLENISIGPMGSNDSENAIDISNVPDGATYTITNCVINDIDGAGIELADTNGGACTLTITNTSITDVGCQDGGGADDDGDGCGISVFFSGNNSVIAATIVIQGCTLTGDAGTSARTERGIDITVVDNAANPLSGTLDVTIGGAGALANTIADFDADGIRLQSSGSVVARCLVENNTVTNNNGFGIVAGPGEDSQMNSRVISNTATGNSFPNIGLSHRGSATNTSRHRVYLTGNSAGDYRIDRDNGTNGNLELGTVAPTAVGSLPVTGDTTDADITTVLTEDGNQTGGGNPSVNVVNNNRAFDVVDESTVLSPP